MSKNGKTNSDNGTLIAIYSDGVTIKVDESLYNILLLKPSYKYVK